ncbi:MAG: hypothetical protein AAF184_03510 [Pseudomonadota bacterium]
MMIATQALACRCAPRPMSEYFAAADIVMIATVTELGGSPDEGQVTLTLDPSVAPYKGDPTDIAFVTAASSAGCGIPALLGRQYLIFATVDPQTPTRAFVSTCEGSRLHDPSVENGLVGFDEVPGAQVAAQLATLQATEALREVNAGLQRLRLRGLLDLEPLAHGGHVTLRSAPASDAAVVKIVRSMDEIPSREATYEFAAAIVMDTAQGWYAIRIDDTVPEAVAWLPSDAAGTYWPLRKLLPDRLTYLTGDWDALLWPDGPGAGRVLRLDRRRERPVVVKEVADLAGSTWLHVDILDASPCEGGAPDTRHAGWIPAWAPNGAPNTWFYARGC